MSYFSITYFTFYSLQLSQISDLSFCNLFLLLQVWPHKDYPLIKVGQFRLNRNPENYHADVEQSAFSPSNFVPGIETSPDKMLQGRLFSYHDTHLHRLGTNYLQIPVNCPYATKVRNYQRDGFMTINGNQGKRLMEFIQ